VMRLNSENCLRSGTGKSLPELIGVTGQVVNIENDGGNRESFLSRVASWFRK